MDSILFFLPNLISIKFGRACHPACPMGRRSSLKQSTGLFQGAHHPRQARIAHQPDRRDQIFHLRIKRHLPCPTAFGLMDNEPENSAPQSFLSARKKVAYA